jgi:lipoyl(octanoyl) transferase
MLGCGVVRTVRLFCFHEPVKYASAWRWQRSIAASVRNGGPEALALLQHEPVYTFGRHPRYEHLLAGSDALRARGAALVESDRGGDITFHGPGQLVAYPILDLKARRMGPRAYVHALEESTIRALAAFGVAGERSTGRPGVWVGGAKIAAVGVRVQSGVSTHGLALNVDTDLSWYDAIVPCGISDASVTSIERVLSFSPGIASVRDVFVKTFAAVFDSRLEAAEPAPEREPAFAHGR